MAIKFVLNIKYWSFSFSVWFLWFLLWINYYFVFNNFTILLPIPCLIYFSILWFCEKKFHITLAIALYCMACGFSNSKNSGGCLSVLIINYARIWFVDNSGPGDYNIYYLLQGSLFQFSDRWPPSDFELTFKHNHHVNVQILHFPVNIYMLLIAFWVDLCWYLCK